MGGGGGVVLGRTGPGGNGRVWARIAAVMERFLEGNRAVLQVAGVGGSAGERPGAGGGGGGGGRRLGAEGSGVPRGTKCMGTGCPGKEGAGGSGVPRGLGSMGTWVLRVQGEMGCRGKWGARGLGVQGGAGGPGKRGAGGEAGCMGTACPREQGE